MPRLKTVPEVATINYLQLHTLTPVPYVYHWDANPYNRLGHEYILMPCVPLHQVFNRLTGDELDAVLQNVADRIPLDASFSTSWQFMPKAEITCRGRIINGLVILPGFPVSACMRTAPVTTPGPTATTYIRRRW